MDTKDTASAPAPAAEKKAATKKAARPESEEREFSSPSLDCRPDVCELGDKMTKWKGLDNFECPKCGYATIDTGELKKRRPDFR